MRASTKDTLAVEGRSGAEECNHHPHTLPVRGSRRRWRALVIRAAPRTPLSQSGGFMRLGRRDVPGGGGRGTLPAEPSFTAEGRTFHQGLAISCIAGLFHHHASCFFLLRDSASCLLATSCRLLILLPASAGSRAQKNPTVSPPRVQTRQRARYRRGTNPTGSWEIKERAAISYSLN